MIRKLFQVQQIFFPSEAEKYSKNPSQDFLDCFTCSICYGLFRNPLQCTNCAQSYCAECLEEYKR